MSGRMTTIGLLGIAIIAGAWLWYTQTFTEYSRFEGPVEGFGAILKLEGDPGRPIMLSSINGIRGTSSPLKFRACFQADIKSLGHIDDVTYLDPIPLTAPSWFDCFNAREIGGDLETGHAQAFLVESEVAEGVDLVAALYPDGRGYAWRQFRTR